MIVENPLSIVAVIDENYEVTFASPGLCDTIGYPYRELIGMDFRKVLTDEQREMIADRYIRRRRGENTPHQYGIDLIAKNGEIRSTIANISLATGPNGEKQSIVNMVDITDRKEINGETNQ
ncbi:hypothetical protein BMS3Bbin04_01021 [bacterium BMS3Bbin04]|nr:hypothetical protein BMS3Bbin04_01021 [bacterium BMS3Bbin04]